MMLFPKTPSDYEGPEGPKLDGVSLADLELLAQEKDVVISTGNSDTPISSALQAMPFASYASLEPQQTGLRYAGEPLLPPPGRLEYSSQQPYSPTEMDSVVAAWPRPTSALLISPQDDDDVQQVLAAGGDVTPSPSEEDISTTAVLAFREALKLLSSRSLGSGLQRFGW